MKSCRDDPFRLAPHGGELTRFDRATRIGDDAERAEILTAVLDLEKCTRALRHVRERDILERPRLHDVRDLPRDAALRAHCLLHIVDDLRALLRPDDDAHALERTDFIRRDLRIAAADSDAGARVRPCRAADDPARLAVAQMRHRAGIDNIDVRTFLERHDIVAARAEQPLHGFRFKLIDLAAERHECNCAQDAPPPVHYITIVPQSRYEQ